MTNLETVRAHVEILRYIKTRQAELKEMEEASRAVIEEMLGGDEVGELDGEVAVTWKHVKSRRLNQRLLKEKLPEVVELYTNVSESRRFEVAT